MCSFNKYLWGPALCSALSSQTLERQRKKKKKHQCSSYSFGTYILEGKTTGSKQNEQISTLEIFICKFDYENNQTKKMEHRVLRISTSWGGQLCRDLNIVKIFY